MSGLLILIFFFGLTVAAGASVFIALVNLKALQPLSGGHSFESFPLVSILVPARNEERTIAECVRALLTQGYPNMEILILDDHSEDRTRELVRETVGADKRVRVLDGDSIPPGWLGKHWACHQLVEAAQGEFILFIDSDTVVGPDVVRDAVGSAIAEEADLFAVMPSRVSRPWADRLVSGIIAWAMTAWMPVGLAHSSSNPSLSATFGPFMLFRKEAYEAIGGHAAIRNNTLDDFELGRRIKSAGLRWRLVDATGRVFTEDYITSAETIDGIARSVFPAFRYNIPLFGVVWIGLFSLGVIPAAVVAYTMLGGDFTPILVRLSWVTVVLLLTSWLITCIRSNLNPFLAAIYPITVLLTLYIGIRSLMRTLNEGHTWKGRSLKGLAVYSNVPEQGPASIDGEEATREADPRDIS